MAKFIFLVLMLMLIPRLFHAGSHTIILMLMLVLMLVLIAQVEAYSGTLSRRNFVRLRAT